MLKRVFKSDNSLAVRIVLPFDEARRPMRKESILPSRKNPYASQLKKQITIRLDEDAIAYFKTISETISEELGIPYQSLINLYFRDCAASHRKLDLNWK